MSTGPSASGASLSATTNLPNAASFTAIGRCKLIAKGSGGFTNIFSLETSAVTAANAVQMSYDNSGTPLFIMSTYPTQLQFARYPLAGQTFYWAMQGRGTGGADLLGFFMFPGERELQVVTAPGRSFAGGGMFLGNGSYGDWGNMRFEDFRLWDVGTLTPREILAEMASPTPIRRAGLNRWNPLYDSSHLGDYGGNGSALTGAGTLTNYATLCLPSSRRLMTFADRLLWAQSAGGGGLTLLLAGARSEEGAGALSLSALLTLAGQRSGEAPGASSMTAVAAVPPVLLYDAYGSPVVSASLATSPAARTDGAGASQIAAALTLAGAPSEERAGAATLSGALVLASALSEERYGALVTSGLLQLPGAATAEIAGAAALLATMVQAGATSEERGGAMTVLQTLTLLLASAGDTSGAGGSTMAAAVQLAGALSGERPGAAGMAGLATLAGAISEEMAGAAQVSANLQTISAGAGAQSTERAGASTMAVSVSLAGAPSGETPGASAMAAALALAGARSEEGAGVLSIAQTLILASAALSEAVGAGTMAASVQLAGARTEEAAGALAMLAKATLAGAPSGESASAATILQTILAVLAGAPSEERAGAAALAGRLALPSAPSEEVAGALASRGLLSLVGAPSSERAGALAILILGFINTPVAFLGGPPLLVAFENSVLTARLAPSVLMASDCSFCTAGKCGADFHLTQDDLAPLLRANLYKPGTKLPQDLTGATITVELQKADLSGPLFGGAVAVIGDPEDGVVEYTWVVGDSDTPGLFTGQFKVVIGGKPISWPTFKFSLRILPKLVAAP
jgi:hypothetical protein